MATMHSRQLMRRAAPSFLVGILLCAGYTATADVTTVGASVRSSAASGPVTGAATPSAGCTKAPGAAENNQRVNLMIDGVQRWYLLTTPSPSTPSPTPAKTKSAGKNASTSIPRPLVVDFHGLAEGAVLHAQTSMFGTLGQKDGFVAVFPNGTGSPVQWNTTDQAGTNPDLEFVTALLAQVESTQCIDTSRVYASGFSDGSYMVSLLACTMSTHFAAIGAVSGLLLDKPCHTARHVPIITFHGTADPILYFNGGIGTALLHSLLGGGGSTAPSSTTTTTTQPAKLHGPGVPATVQSWAVKDGCSPKSTDRKVSSQVILRTYKCPATTSVEFYIILGGGHAWPGSKVSQSISKITGFTTFQINATNKMWSFFQKFQL
jgi:polyhydroxybutyrate depolymerase